MWIWFFPDENGSCSYTDNCEISYQGKCPKCIEDYILIGGKNSLITICKSLNSEDLKNYKQINIEKGFCEKCIEGYFLGKGDNKRINIENCFESFFGVWKNVIMAII